jgi:hypothetical protein
MPKLLKIHIIFHALKLLNFFPMKGGVLDTLSPKTIMCGEILDYKKHLRLQIREYCQVHEEDTPRNSLRPRTKGASSLGPSANLQGGFKFMALNTGKKIIRRSWDMIPMLDTVIACVNMLMALNTGKKIIRRSWDMIPMLDTVIACVNMLGSNQPEQLVFTDRHGRLIGDTDDANIP